VDVLRLFSNVIEKDIVSVRSGKLPERRNANLRQAGLEKLKEVRATTRFDFNVEDMLEALAKHSDTDWCGRESNKLFTDSDAAWENALEEDSTDEED